MTPNRPSFSHWLRGTNDITTQFLAVGGRPDIVSLAGGLPAPELYPVGAVKEATLRALDRWGSDALEYGPVEGLPALRDAIAAKHRAQTGGAIATENILITSGSMQGLDLLGKVLIDAEDKVVVQFPTYVGALDAWRPRQPRYQPLDWELARQNQTESLRHAKFVYAVPNYSNPTGVLVPQSQRVALLQAARDSGTWLVEDDPYASLQLEGSTGPCILANDMSTSTSAYHGPVVYLGTLSKTIVPGLRIGWVIADEVMIRALTMAKVSSDLSGCMFTQAIALELLEQGVDVTHAATMLPHYRARRDALCAAVAEHLREWFEWETPPGGMFLWLRAKRTDVDAHALLGYALEEKVAFVPGSAFDSTGGLSNCMRLNFTRAKPEVLREGAARLARAVQRYLKDNRQGERLHR